MPVKDFIIGGSGNDAIDGGDGDDTIFGDSAGGLNDRKLFVRSNPANYTRPPRWDDLDTASLSLAITHHRKLHPLWCEMVLRAR